VVVRRIIPVFWNLKSLSLIDDDQYLQLEGGLYIHTEINMNVFNYTVPVEQNIKR
jgi:hypothetical protein